MSTRSSRHWRDVFKHYLASARVSVLAQLLRDEIHWNINANSTILMSNVDTAVEILQWYTDSHKHGLPIPVIVIAQELTETTNIEPLNKRLPSAAQIRSLEQLGDNEFTHAFLHIHTDRSERDLLKLFQQVHKLLGANGRLVVSRRKRDGLANILHAAGVQLPGRQQGSGFATSRLDDDDGLALIASQAGFSQNRIIGPEKPYILQGEQLQHLLDDMRVALTPSLDSYNGGSGWRSDFEKAARKEMTEHGGISLIATAIVATK
jgi:hypothetical protein